MPDPTPPEEALARLRERHEAARKPSLTLIPTIPTPHEWQQMWDAIDTVLNALPALLAVAEAAAALDLSCPHKGSKPSWVRRDQVRGSDLSCPNCGHAVGADHSPLCHALVKDIRERERCAPCRTRAALASLAGEGGEGT